MNQKLNRIDSFLRELVESGLTDEQKSVVLQPAMAELDGGDNSGICSNTSPDGCATNKKNCTNFGSACSKNDNQQACANKELDHYICCGGSQANPMPQCSTTVQVGICTFP